MHVRSGSTTFSEFLELVQEDQKADLLDGVIYMASPENLDHNELVAWLVKVMGLFVEERRLGRITVNKVAYRLSTHNAPEPDIAFVSTERMGMLKKGYVDGPPDLAVEIISPDSVDRDYEFKRRNYEEAGVREYWIIDPDEHRATFLIRGAQGFVEGPVENHVFRSGVLAGFALDVRWLFERPLPATLPIVQALLARAESR